MQDIFIERVSKSFQSNPIISDLSLTIPAGKFFVLLGPSGCGKTTLLRLIAGLESADSGKIFLGSTDITHQPIYDRKVNTVFQQYALFPHLTVFENVAYALRVKNMPNVQVSKKVQDALSLVRLQGMGDKRIQSLSGGQKQRVSLARAIVSEPKVLLLDEPLAAIDFNLKEQLLIRLMDVQEKLNTTFIYVTHDQFEALTVADSIAIMNESGSIEQIGSPKEIYEFPQSLFAAQFIGKTNVLRGLLRVDGNVYQVDVDGLGTFGVPEPQNSRVIPGGHVALCVRPEKIEISKKVLDGFTNHVQGTVENIIYYGQSTQYHVRIKTGQILVVFEQNERHFETENIDYDEHVHLYFQKENLVLLGC